MLSASPSSSRNLSSRPTLSSTALIAAQVVVHVALVLPAHQVAGPSDWPGGTSRCAVRSRRPTAARCSGVRLTGRHELHVAVGVIVFSIVMSWSRSARPRPA